MKNRKEFTKWLKELPDDIAEQLWCALDSGMVHDMIEIIAKSHPAVVDKNSVAEVWYYET